MASSAKKPHAVVIPFPAQGHVNPLMIFAKLLHARGFHITFVHTEFNYSRLIRSNGPDSMKGLPDFRYETIPDGTPPPSNQDATQDVSMLCASLRENGLSFFKKLLDKLNASPHDDDDDDDDVVPPVTCVVADGCMTFAVRAAELLGVPGVNFYASSAYSYIGFLYYNDLMEQGIFPFKNDDYLSDGTLDTPIEVTGMGKIHLRDLPSFFQTTDPNDFIFHYARSEYTDCLKATGLVLYTFEEFEQEAIDAIKTKYDYPNVYCISPLSLLEQKHVPESQSKQLISSLWEEDPKVFEWLDNKEHNSVLYVSYGCLAVMASKDFQELAWGIAKSKQSFLWVVRPDVVKDGSPNLSTDYLEEIKDRGYITSWCAQEKVLNHPAVGAFLTHCGWNSLTETICGGVPVICWPWYADQQTNCHYACTKWGIGMEMNRVVKRDEVSLQIKEIMVGEKGQQMRGNAQEWKQKAEKATDVGGSSYNYLDKLIKDVLLHENEDV